jgi:hypothetical protein
VPTAKSPKQQRKRCQNCNKLFVPKPNLGRRAKFCKKECCDEFHRHGSAFGPMKLGLYAAIDKKYAQLESKMRFALRTVTLAMEVLNNDVKALRALVSKAEQRFGEHIHLETVNVERSDPGRSSR